MEKQTRAREEYRICDLCDELFHNTVNMNGEIKAKEILMQVTDAECKANLYCLPMARINMLIQQKLNGR